MSSKQIVDSEEQINKIREKEIWDDFVIKRVFKYFTLTLIIIAGGTVTAIFIQQLAVNPGFRTDVLNLIKDNLPAIVISGLSILVILKATKDS